jgi:group II intron reverse transcriptase/maturase
MPEVGWAVGRLPPTLARGTEVQIPVSTSIEYVTTRVWEAYKQVEVNRGAGVDGQSIEDFDRDLSKNLYRIWNRMCSGSYFPPPVRRVDIPKGETGGTRPLGIPTVADRIAQMVVKRYLEPILEPVFHPDSYGYRPGKSAHNALAVARRRCWRHDWVLDLDIKSFFEDINWGLLMQAVRRHTDCRWVLLYLQRWLEAPVSMPEGTLVERRRGTPQGGVATPRTQKVTFTVHPQFAG